MKGRTLSPVMLLAVIAACADATSPSSARMAPLAEPTMSIGTQLIPNEFIVVLEDNADVPAAANRARGRGGEVVAEWSNALRGFAVRGGPSVIAAVRSDPDVRFVEQSQEFTTQTTQNGATWGLDRIDQASLPLNGTYTYNATAANVTAYIIDTGIRTSHSEFQGRATWGTNTAGGSNTDCNGHGTHVAGTVGGQTYGVAKGVRLVAVKVLNCAGSGSTTGVISGVNWVATNRTLPAVANMSLGGGASSSLDVAVNNAINAGVTFVVAAGNNNANACNYSPARVANAITVGATTSTDARASYSNFGTCLDIFAPGSGITSAWKNNNNSTNTISGTSMASPHVAGVAALILAGTPGASPAAVRNTIVSTGSAVVTNPGTGSTNKLVNKGTY